MLRVTLRATEDAVLVDFDIVGASKTVVNLIENQQKCFLFSLSPSADRVRDGDVMMECWCPRSGARRGGHLTRTSQGPSN